MDSKKLILVGGGGHCKSVINVIRLLNREIKGILDIPEKVGNKILDVPIIGTDKNINEYISDCEFVVTLGFIENPNVRIRLFQQIANLGGNFATLISPLANVSKYSRIGKGTVILNGVNVNADALVGENVILNTNSNIEHDVVVSDHCHISTGACINGVATIGKAVFVGSNSVVNNCIYICDDVIIGSGGVVIKDIVSPGKYVGNPCRKL